MRLADCSVERQRADRTHARNFHEATANLALERKIFQLLVQLFLIGDHPLAMLEQTSQVCPKWGRCLAEDSSQLCFHSFAKVDGARGATDPPAVELDLAAK